MSKAYGRLRWDFLYEILRRMGFSQLSCDLIHNCIFTVKYSIVIYGATLGNFGASNGLRQGDLLSSYLFVIALKGLSRMLTCASSSGCLCGLSIARGAPKFTYLFFLLMTSDSFVKQLLRKLVP